MRNLKKTKEPAVGAKFPTWRRFSRWHYLPCLLALAFGVFVSALLFRVLQERDEQSTFLRPVLGITLSLVATAVLIGYLINSSRRTEKVEQLVDQRTADLTEANRLLLHEVEERQRAEGALERVRDQLELRVIERTRELTAVNDAFRLRDRAIAAAINPVVITDVNQPDHPIIYCNPAFEGMTGYTAAEVLGKNCRFLQLDQGHQVEENRGALEVLRGAIRGGEGCQVVLRNFKKDGTPFWNELTISPVRDPIGRVTHFLGFQADITRRKEAEEALVKARQELEERVAERTVDLSRANESLKLAEAKYRGIFENAVEGIYQSRPDGTYVSVNPALARMYGYTSPQDLMEKVKDIGKQIYLDSKFRDDFARLMEENHEVYGLEYQVRRRDGSTMWICEHARAVMDGNGSILFYEGIIQDISKRKHAESDKNRLEEQLRQSQKMQAIGTLAGGIAHDFNNILGAIIGFSELTLDELPLDSKPRRNLEQVHKAGMRAKDLVQQILSFSRQNKAERAAIKVGPIVKEVMKLVRASLPSTIEMKVAIGTEQDSCVADAVQVHQVLMNLCTNAGHAMREKGGRLEVRLEAATAGAPRVPSGLKAGPYLRLSVSDTGHGMESTVQERIFEPFFTTKPIGEGTGLGLSVVHGIIKSHGGEITVSSAVHQGTTFEVFLPQSEMRADDLKPETGPARGASERILLVDDEEALTFMMQQILEKLGYQVTAFTNSRQALEAFKADSKAFDLVLTDQTMPRMTGAELMAEVHSLRPELPVIVCTGYDRNSMNSAGGLFILKPVDVRVLAEMIRKALADKAKLAPQALAIEQTAIASVQ
jgi:PAS domain S-box-containing protein